MSFGKRLLEARKWKVSPKEELAKHLGTKGPAIGRYERDEMTPSIEAAAKMAELLDFSLDYLVGKTDVLLVSKITKRIMEIQKLSPKNKKLSSPFSMLFCMTIKPVKLMLLKK